MELIDVHGHYITPYYRRKMDDAGQLLSDLVPLPPWEPDQYMETMFDIGISHSIISAASPNQSFGDKALALDLTRESNETGAVYVGKYPGRLSLAAALPLPYVDESLREIKYVFDTLGVKSIRILSNSLGVYPGSPETEPVFEELNRRKAVIILHPTRPQEFPKGPLSSVTIPLFEFFPETCRAVFNLILSGTIRRFPDIKIIVPHCGALVIPLLERIENLYKVYAAGHEGVEPANVLEDASTLYFDIAGNPLPRQLDTLLTFIDPGHVLYGTDFPWNSAVSAKKLLSDISSRQFDEQFINMMFYMNARALFPSGF